eukprot:TRINITY_DN1759_c0_g1_i1.p1 TRINITY_DN1759_c0_g1~~TRINITY_DN1759_c0_g1_i1.p1  ORF type:complete len:134 (+),score=15.70 TRINITY_DN1759_c0_g1_i1:41-403(+)
MTLPRLLSGIQRNVCRQLKFQEQYYLLKKYGFAGEATFLQPNEVTQRIINVVKTMENVDQNKVSDKSHFQKDLGLDSLDVVELVMAIEEEFKIEIPDAEADKIQSVHDAVEYIRSNPNAE